MANLSQQKRDKLIAFLESLRLQHNDDDSLIALGEIENDLVLRKYGMLWEKHDEEVDRILATKIPVFTEDLDREFIGNSELNSCNFLLEGDNLHSLLLLEKTHKRKIDVIYIDPPYNTGGTDFVYDDSYVDSIDCFKHSKWLSFMQRRLSIAKRLLSDDGVIFISIDDHEVFQLKLLCDEIFGEENFTAAFPRLATKSGKTPVAYMVSHDYVLCYTSQKKDVFVGESFEDSSYKYSDEFEEKRGKYNLKQPLDCNSISYSSSLDYPIEHDGVTYYPGGDYDSYVSRKNGNHLAKDYAWRWSRDLYEFGLKNGWIVFQNGRIYTKGYLNAIIEKNRDTGEYYISYREKTRKISTIDFITNTYSNDIAKKQLKSCKVGMNFDYPKPIELIKKLISTYYKKDALVLDFFAGSGTTAQAIIELNASDGGRRKFILCTNNQNGICENVTYQRVKTVLSGKTSDGKPYERPINTLLFEKELKQSDLKNNSVLQAIDIIKEENKGKFDKFVIEFEGGFIQLWGVTLQRDERKSANLKYYTTDYVDRESEEISDDLLDHICEMIQLEHGVKIDNTKYVIILDDEDMDDFEKNIQNYPDLKIVYINSDVLLSNSQERMLRNIETHIIPDYYFDFELREAGELW